jgi:hypothetical protein
VVLFARQEDYLRFIAAAGGPATGSGHVADGVVASWRLGRQPEEVRATLVHELVHLINRRALGPALPPWLDEGIADDLAESAVGPGGRLVPGTLAEVTLRTGQVRLDHYVGAASGHLLRRALANGSLPPIGQLAAADGEAFWAVTPLAVAYAQASFFVRFLLAGELAAGFRDFLARVAEGGDPSVRGLEAALALDAGELDRRYRAWLAQAAEAEEGAGGGATGALW